MEIEDKQLVAVRAGCVGMFMSTSFILVMKYLYQRAHIDDEEWDIKNTTLGDFSVEITIT